jgi:hypothetical protein
VLGTSLVVKGLLSNGSTIMLFKTLQSDIEDSATYSKILIRPTPTSNV